MTKMQQRIIDSVFYKRVPTLYSVHYEFDNFKVYPRAEAAEVYYKGIIVEKMPVSEFFEAVERRRSSEEISVKEEWSKL